MDINVKASPRNRRSSVRKNPRSSVRVECRRGPCGLGANIAVGFLDLSEGGVRILTKDPLTPKEEVEIVISSFGHQKPVKRVANVAWSLTLEDGRFCVGLAFQKRLAYAEVVQFSRP